MGTYSTTVIIDFDLTNQGWELVARFDADLIAAHTGVPDDERMDDAAESLMSQVVDAVLTQRDLSDTTGEP